MKSEAAVFPPVDHASAVGNEPAKVSDINNEMNTETSMDKSGAYFISQLKDRPERAQPPGVRRLKPTISISHQTGAGAPEIAEQLIRRLQKTELKGDRPWTLYNHQLIENALLEQRLPKRLAEKITEEKRFFIHELIDDVFDLQPPSWVLIPQVRETTLRLAEAGYVILVGHGATVVTAQLANVFHVRLTGSVSKRIERVQKLDKLTPEAAARFVKTEDRKRNKFLKAHFHARLDNELLHDLAINTDRVSNEDAVALISEGAQRFFSER